MTLRRPRQGSPAAARGPRGQGPCRWAGEPIPDPESAPFSPVLGWLPLQAPDPGEAPRALAPVLGSTCSTVAGPTRGAGSGRLVPGGPHLEAQAGTAPERDLGRAQHGRGEDTCGRELDVGVPCRPGKAWSAQRAGWRALEVRAPPARSQALRR